MSNPPTRYPDRGWVHAVPAIGFVGCVVAYPLYVLVTTFQSADADISTRPGAPFAAFFAATLACLAGLLVAGFVTMVAYTAARFGRTRLVRVAQLAGLVVTSIGCVAGLWLAYLVATQIS